MSLDFRKTQPPVKAALEWWNSVRERWQSMAEIDALSGDEVERLANEVGLAADDLRKVVREPDGVPVLLGRRLTALHLDAAEIRKLAPLLMRDLERTCATCGDKKQCRKDFEAGENIANWERYCPNAGTLRTLV